MIQKDIGAIEQFSVQRNSSMSVQDELMKNLEGIDLDLTGTKSLEHSINYIKMMSTNFPPLILSRPQIEGCLEQTREVVIHLKMIQWGIYGLGTFTSGQFLANHHHMLGPYFGDSYGNEWPKIPLHKEPKKLENDFNQLLTDITFLAYKHPPSSLFNN